MDLVLIYGPPAAGKLTVATELSRLTGYRLFHNHLSISCVLPVFDFGTAPFNRLVRSIRRSVIAEAAGSATSLITTFVYVHPEDTGLVWDIHGSFEEAGGRICPVQLVCARETLMERIGRESRVAGGKLTSADVLSGWLDELDLLSPLPDRHSLTLDSGRMTPSEAAARIAAHFGLPAHLS